MDLFFAGTEQKVWRTLLRQHEVEHVSLSYIGLRRRRKDPMGFSIAEEYPGQQVYLDSGAYTLNKEDSEVGQDEAWELMKQYHAFVEANLDAIEFASEFDANVLGKESIWDLRATFWQHLPVTKWMPIWHAEYGTTELQDMGEEYARVGVLQGDTGHDLTPLLRRLAGRTQLHGVAMTKMESMAEIPWASVGSTSWLSPTQYGDTFVWTGREMKRYPKRMKDQARKRHRTWLMDQGFNVDLIEADDNAELLRLSIWSWRNFAASLEKGRGVTISVLNPFGQIPEPGGEEVDTPTPPMGNAELVPRAGKKLLPVLGVQYKTRTDDDGNEISEPHLTTPSSGLLRCDNCFMREKCPESTPGSECAFEIPAKVRTGSQLASLQDWLIETQAQRVAFMRMVEQAEGGYSDANLTTEMLHLARMIKAKQEASREGFSIKIEGSATPGGPGMIGRIFGSDVTERMGALAAPVESSDIIAEVISETEE
jgi:hypothetical protein